MHYEIGHALSQESKLDRHVERKTQEEGHKHPALTNYQTNLRMRLQRGAG